MTPCILIPTCLCISNSFHILFWSSVITLNAKNMQGIFLIVLIFPCAAYALIVHILWSFHCLPHIYAYGSLHPYYSEISNFISNIFWIVLAVFADHSGRGLRHELSSFARMLGSWVRIPLKAWMSVHCVRLFCVSMVLCTGSGLATDWYLIQGVLPTDCVKDQETEKRPRPNKGL
jgi:hypothetical protein